MTTPLRKYPFWSKKGKPTKGESKILNEIKKLCKKHKISESEVVSKFGLMNDELSLNQLFANLNDEISKNSTSSGQQSTVQPAETETQTTETTEQMNAEKTTNSPSDEIPESEGLGETEGTQKETSGKLPPDPDPYATKTKERSYSTGQGQQSEGKQSSQSEKKEEKKQQPFNDDSSLNDIPETGPAISPNEPRVVNPDRLRRGAESYVRGYNEIVLGFGKMFSKFSERKIKKLQRNKQIDLDYEEELPSGEKQTIGDYIHEHNERVEEVLVPNKENDKIIVEALMEVMAERNHQPSPTQVLIQEVLYDFREKTEHIVELVATQRDTLDYFIESHADRMEAMNGKKEEKETGLTPTEDVN